MVQTSDNLLDLDSEYMGEWEQFTFQLPDCFNGSCSRMPKRVIMEQNNSLVKVTAVLLVSYCLQLGFEYCSVWCSSRAVVIVVVCSK